MVYTLAMKTVYEIKNWLKEHLNNERYIHSLGCADSAKKLAKMYNLDEEKAYLAGLVHDCAKCYSNEQLENILVNNMSFKKDALINPKTYHSPAGAYVAKHELGINDEEILSAIHHHTIGKLNMTTFEKIIFLADKIEAETRDKIWREKILSILPQENGLDKSLLECYSYTIKSLIDRKLKICLDTINIYNELLSKIE